MTVRPDEPELTHEELEHAAYHGDARRIVEMVAGVGKDVARLPIAERVLLPVDEVGLGRDAQAVAEDAGPAMRRGPEPHDLRAEADATRVAIAHMVLQSDVDGHGVVLPRSVHRGVRTAIAAHKLWRDPPTRGPVAVR